MSLAERLRHEVLVLDGGMSNALEDDGADMADPLWTARLLRDEPHRVADVHERYFAAGADVATTATYQAPVELLAPGVALAREVRDRVAPRALVAGSLGPYGALLADGSEYSGRYGLSRAKLHDVHAPRLEALAAAGPDVVAVETVPDLDEAEVLLNLLGGLGLPAWLSYSVAGGRTRAGQPLDEAYAAVAATDVLPGSTARRPATCSMPSQLCPARPSSTPTAARTGTPTTSAGRGAAPSTWRWCRGGSLRAPGSSAAAAASVPTTSAPCARPWTGSNSVDRRAVDRHRGGHARALTHLPRSRH